jgi:hypothetical protein
LDQIQGVLGFSVTKQEWVNRNVRRTALLYEVVEELFLIFVRRYNAHSSGLTLLAEASETFSDDEVASTVLLLNPAMDLRDGASTLDERLFAWQERLTRRFGEERHQEILSSCLRPHLNHHLLPQILEDQADTALATVLDLAVLVLALVVEVVDSFKVAAVMVMVNLTGKGGVVGISPIILVPLCILHLGTTLKVSPCLLLTHQRNMHPLRF